MRGIVMFTFRKLVGGLSRGGRYYDGSMPVPSKQVLINRHGHANLVI